MCRIEEGDERFVSFANKLSIMDGNSYCRYQDARTLRLVCSQLSNGTQRAVGGIGELIAVGNLSISSETKVGSQEGIISIDRS